MDGLKTILLIVCIVNTAVAYNCIEKSCVGGICSPESECPVNGTYGCMNKNLNSKPFEPDQTQRNSKLDAKAVMITASAQGVITYYYTSDVQIFVNRKKEERYLLDICISSQGCSEQMCKPVWSNTTGTEVTNDCCFTEKCNIDSMTSTVDDPNVDQCYSIQCDTEGCLKDAISNGKARICTRSSNESCMYSKIDGDQYIESASCLEVDDATCVTAANYNIPDGMTMIVECCKENLCNDGIQVKQPGVDYCYAVNCNNTGCIEEAIANNAYAICPQTEHGCMTSVTDGFITTSCAKDTCVTLDIASFSTKCCKGDLCNGPTVTTASPGTSPSTDASSTTEKDSSGAEIITNSLFLMCSIFIFMSFI